jgi:hypothetical protein
MGLLPALLTSPRQLRDSALRREDGKVWARSCRATAAAGLRCAVRTLASIFVNGEWFGQIVVGALSSYRANRRVQRSGSPHFPEARWPRSNCGVAAVLTLCSPTTWRGYCVWRYDYSLNSLPRMLEGALCGECGTRLIAACSSCGAPNPPAKSSAANAARV